MDLDRFLELPETTDGRKVVTLMADPSMTDATGQPAGFLSLVDKGANLRRFQVVKSADLAPHQGPTGAPGEAEHGPAWLVRFLDALGLGSLAAKLARKSDAPALTFDAAVTRERLRRARWEATDALWEVIGNVMASDLEDKAGAVGLALSQFSATVMGLVTATMAVKAEDRPNVLAVLEDPGDGPGTTSKAGRVISARNRATLESARDALAQAVAALEDLIKVATPSDPASKADPADPLEDFMNAAQLKALADQAATSAITAAKSAGITSAADLARIGSEASTQVYKAAVMGPAQPAMPTDTLAAQLAASGGMNGNAADPLAKITEALGAVTGLATKVDALVSKVDNLDRALNGHGEGEAREPGALELVTKSAELATATAERVAKIEGTPVAPRGSGDPERPAVVARKGAGDEHDKTWQGSPFQFTAPAPAPQGQG